MKDEGRGMNRTAQLRRRACLRPISAFILALPAPAFAHGDEPHSWSELARAWSFEPGIVIALALSAWLYWRGVRRMWRERGGERERRGVRRWEAWAYAGGWLALFVALDSPLHPLGRVLFSAHMTQHEILMLVAAPLL